MVQNKKKIVLKILKKGEWTIYFWPKMISIKNNR